MTLQTVVFWCFAAWAIVSALLVVTRTNPIASVMWLVSCMFALAGLFVLLDAQFVAAIQVLVYAGAVMVLFLFAVMLLNLEGTPRDWKRWPLWLLGTGVTAVLGAQLLSLGRYSPARLAGDVSTMPSPDPRLVFPEGEMLRQAVARDGVVGAVARPMFEGYLVPFEITSVLLLVAVVGAVVLAKKRL
jgi:NADH-quinone oxidoreductase subunit J